MRALRIPCLCLLATFLVIGNMIYQRYDRRVIKFL